MLVDDDEERRVFMMMTDDNDDVRGRRIGIDMDRVGKLDLLIFAKVEFSWLLEFGIWNLGNVGLCSAHPKSLDFSRAFREFSVGQMTTN